MEGHRGVHRNIKEHGEAQRGTNTQWSLMQHRNIKGIKIHSTPQRNTAETKEAKQGTEVTDHSGAWRDKEEYSSAQQAMMKHWAHVGIKIQRGIQRNIMWHSGAERDIAVHKGAQ